MSTVALGPGDPTERMTAFQPWSDGDPVPVIFGGQGARMIVARLEVTPAVGDCLAQQTVVRDEQGTQIAADRSPVLSYPAVDGSGAAVPDTSDTYAIFLPGSYPPPGAHLVVTTTIGALSVTHTLLIVEDGVDLAPARDLAAPDLASSD